MKKRAVVWQADALDNFDRIGAYIARNNPAAAMRVVDRIEKTGNDLGKAAIGHYGRVEGTYEVGVSRLPYIIAYAVEPDGRGGECIVILHVIHGARDWRAGQWPD